MADSVIVKTPGTCGGFYGDARIAGTPIYVWGLVEMRRLRYPDKRILQDYAHITREQLEAAWKYATDHPEEINDCISRNALAFDEGSA